MDLIDLFFYPAQFIIGYIFICFKYKDKEQRKQILLKEYDDSYATAGSIITGQIVIGIFAVFLAGCIISVLVGLVYTYLIKTPKA
jgi:hypothetical protein